MPARDLPIPPHKYTDVLYDRQWTITVHPRPLGVGAGHDDLRNPLSAIALRVDGRPIRPASRLLREFDTSCEFTLGFELRQMYRALPK
jgi:hypothetical protein